jgi:hypothetical protein
VIWMNRDPVSIVTDRNSDLCEVNHSAQSQLTSIEAPRTSRASIYKSMG